MRNGGFLVGAVGGLALALLLVGVFSLFPTPFQVVPGASARSIYVAAPGASPAGVPEYAGGVAAPAPSPARSAFSAAAGTPGHAQERPGSLLAALPGEGVGGLIVTVSPLLVGLLAAALVYGAYTRRQDAPS